MNSIPEGTQLLIIVDSSSSDEMQCKEIMERGIDIIILDHHDLERDNPHPILVNPKQQGCEYPNKEASGSLITWKVCEALDEYLSTSYADELIDLAGFSILSDSMSVFNLENRYFINEALKKVRNTGLKILFEECGKKTNNIIASDFSYSISPCLTAATRMDKLEIALELLNSDDLLKCKKLSEQLVELNEERKKIQSEYVERVKPQINTNDKCIIIIDDSLGKGFNGVIAQELAQTYQRPVIILGDSSKDDEYAGSFRSFGSFKMRSFLKKVSHAVFSAGHEGAGGTGCKKENFEAFKSEINHLLRNEKFEQFITYELELDASEIHMGLIEDVHNFYRITGKDFQTGKFLIKGLFVEDKNPLSKKHTNYEHTRITCENLEVVKFKTNKEYFDSFPVFKAIDAIGSLKLNQYERYDRNLRRKVPVVENQMFLEEYRLSN
jgi:single-stranded-DNA-specific exonuclease